MINVGTILELMRLAQGIPKLELRLDGVRQLLRENPIPAHELSRRLDDALRVKRKLDGAGPLNLEGLEGKLHKASQALAAAVRPLPDFERLFPGLDLEPIESSLTSVNAAIEAADFIADLNLPGAEALPADADSPPEEAERLLDAGVPNATVETLRRVEFVPVTMLQEIRRNPEAMRALTARNFERFIAAIVDALGFEDVILTPYSGDGGRDVLATKTVHGIPILFALECKRWSPKRPVGPDVARALLGVISRSPTRAHKGIVVTTSRFTSGAGKYILTEPSLDGRDFDGIVEWLRACAPSRGSGGSS